MYDPLAVKYIVSNLAYYQQLSQILSFNLTEMLQQQQPKINVVKMCHLASRNFKSCWLELLLLAFLIERVVPLEHCFVFKKYELHVGKGHLTPLGCFFS